MSEKRRKPWVAGLLSLIVPGLGHMYSGEAKKGLCFYGLFWIVGFTVLMVMAELPFAPFNVAVPLLVVFSTYLFIMGDSIRTAKRQGETYRLKVYNKWYLYLIAIVLLGFVVQPALSSAIRTHVVQAYKIPSGGMLPTLVVGDHILVSKRAYRVGTPNRGDVIVFKFPQDERRDFIKRVIGLPGETVEIREGEVYVEGIRLNEPYLVHLGVQSGTGRSSRDAFGPIAISEGHFFMLGDNRNSSMDSRYWGLLRSDKVLGKAVRVYWSWDRAARRVRWERIGQTIR